MEFCDRLKARRLEKQVSQQKLADAIFVSRSAVAKWENGLGIPNETSYAALLAYFELTEQEFPLNEESEARSIGKNKKIRRLTCGLVVLSVVIALMVASFLLLISQDDFAMSSAAAVEQGFEADACIRTPEYDFYIQCPLEEPRWGWISSFRAVKNGAVGYRAVYEENYRHRVLEGDKVVGDIYVFEGKDRYYYVIPAHTRLGKTFAGATEELLLLLSEIKVNNEVYVGQYGGFFTIPYEMSCFEAAGKIFLIE